jgi:recombination protein RecT
LPAKSLIQQAANKAAPNPAQTGIAPAAKQSVSAILNGILDGEGYRKRIDEILGKRAPQFISSVVTMAANDTMLSKVVASAPQTIITSALKAAALDLPIDPALGTAYVVPFKNKVKKPDGTDYYRDEATMIVGWKGLVQLAQRTGLYKRINADFVYEGETIVDDRISGDIRIEGEKTSDKVIGYFAYFQLVNGFEKCVCWTREKVAAHEAKHRKGQYQSKAWRDDFDAMGRKTVLRELISKWGPLSIDYRTAPPEMARAAESLQDAIVNDEDNAPIEGEGVVFEDAPASAVDPDTGEIHPQ